MRPPRLVEFAQQFGGAYLSTEGALWRTLALLLFRPGELTRQYLAGRRKHYVLPLRLYLTISVTALLALRLLTAADVHVGPTVTIGEPGKGKGTLNLAIGGGRAGLKDGQFFCSDLPDWVCRRLKRRIDIDPKAVDADLTLLKERYMANLGPAMFVLLPGFALWLRLAYWNRGRRYTEHLVFALHVHAFWFLMLLLVVSDDAVLTSIGCTAVPLYTLLAMKRVYGGRLLPRLARAGLVSVLYGTTLVLALAAVGLATLLS